jgi:hypothetical protein
LQIKAKSMARTISMGLTGTVCTEGPYLRRVDEERQSSYPGRSYGGHVSGKPFVGGWLRRKKSREAIVPRGYLWEGPNINGPIQSGKATECVRQVARSIWVIWAALEGYWVRPRRVPGSA